MRVRVLWLATVCLILDLCNACFITNCPHNVREGRSVRIGKRSSGIRKCPPCGPGREGQCFGPDLCCGPFGCLSMSRFSASCRDEMLNPIPCRPEAKSCGYQNTGFCALDGICCLDGVCEENPICNVEESDIKERDTTALLEDGVALMQDPDFKMVVKDFNKIFTEEESDEIPEFKHFSPEEVAHILYKIDAILGTNSSSLEMMETNLAEDIGTKMKRAEEKSKFPSPGRAGDRVVRDPTLYSRLGRSAPDAKVTRLGRAADSRLYARLGRAANQLIRGSSNKYSRLGRSAPKPNKLRSGNTYSRLGRSPNKYSRLGRSANAYSRLGRSDNMYSRLGRSPNKYSRLGRSSNKYSRLGRSPNKYSRLGRSDISAGEEYDSYHVSDLSAEYDSNQENDAHSSNEYVI